MTRRNLYFIVAVILGATLAILGLFFFGIIWFNDPSINEFPARGIDVSNHQGAIDWREVRGAGISFAFIKATEGGDFVDKRFRKNWSSSRQHGILTGAYLFYTLCRSGADQARNFIATVPRVPDSLPPAIDLEFTGNFRLRPASLDFRRDIEVFYTMVKDHYGQEPVVYTTYEFLDQYPISKYLKRLWIRDIFTRPRAGLRWAFWQYSNRGSISGVPGFVDLNVYAGSLAELSRPWNR